MLTNKREGSEKSTKERILEAAIDLFAEKGYHAVSVRQITRAVGLKESSLYNHFKSKMDLLHTIFDIFQKEVGETGFPLEEIENNLERMDLYTFLQHHGLKVRERLTPLASKIWRIVYMEQFRNERARRFVLDEIMGRPAAFYQKTFEIAAKKGLIEGENLEMLALTYQYTALTLGWEQMLREIDGEDTTYLFKKRMNLVQYICKQGGMSNE